MSFEKLSIAAMALLISVVAAKAETACLVIADAPSGETIHREGQGCDEAIGPASTFKLTLAVMGYDAGVLVDAENPAWPYDPSYQAARRAERQTMTPRTWMRDSVIWYSRVLVQQLGAERFAAYVAAFDYGNADVSGDAGADNGMTHSWLNTSLQISPMEQLEFVRRLVTGNLPVATAAIAKAASVVPVFEADAGWRLHGKTGTGYIREADGKLGRRQYGWFIGWASAEERTLVFAYLVKDEATGLSAAGPRARDDLVARWPDVVGGK